jgi:hypothetical protein
VEVKMNKTKEDLLNQINNMEYRDNYLKNIKRGEKYDLFLIKMNCIKNKCPNLDILRIDNDAYFICNDNWSGFDLGWQIIYCELLDICFENKIKIYSIPHPNPPTLKMKIIEEGVIGSRCPICDSTLKRKEWWHLKRTICPNNCKI